MEKTHIPVDYGLSPYIASSDPNYKAKKCVSETTVIPGLYKVSGAKEYRQCLTNCRTCSDSTTCSECQMASDPSAVMMLKTSTTPHQCVLDVDSIQIDFMLVQRYEPDGISDLSFKLKLREELYEYKELALIKRRLVSKSPIFTLTGKFKKDGVVVGFTQRIGYEDYENPDQLYLSLNMTSSDPSFTKPKVEELIELTITTTDLVHLVEIPTNPRNIFLAKVSMKINGVFYGDKVMLSSPLQTLAKGIDGGNKVSIHSTMALFLVLGILAADPEGLCLKFNQFLTLLQRFKFFGIFFGAKLGHFIDLVSGWKRPPRPQQTQSRVRRIVQRLEGNHRMLFQRGAEDFKNGHKYKFEKYEIPLKLEGAILFKCIAYLVSWVFKVVAMVLYNQMVHLGKIIPWKIYYIVYSRRIHFVIFGLSLLDLLFFGTRIILHRVDDLGGLFNKALCFCLVALLAVDLASVYQQSVYLTRKFKKDQNHDRKKLFKRKSTQVRKNIDKSVLNDQDSEENNKKRRVLGGKGIGGWNKFGRRIPVKKRFAGSKKGLAEKDSSASNQDFQRKKEGLGQSSNSKFQNRTQNSQVNAMIEFNLSIFPGMKSTKKKVHNKSIILTPSREALTYSRDFGNQKKSKVLPSGIINRGPRAPPRRAGATRFPPNSSFLNKKTDIIDHKKTLEENLDNYAVVAFLTKNLTDEAQGLNSLICLMFNLIGLLHTCCYQVLIPALPLSSTILLVILLVGELVFIGLILIPFLKITRHISSFMLSTKLTRFSLLFLFFFICFLISLQTSDGRKPVNNYLQLSAIWVLILGFATEYIFFGIRIGILIYGVYKNFTKTKEQKEADKKKVKKYIFYLEELRVEGVGPNRNNQRRAQGVKVNECSIENNSLNGFNPQNC